MLTEERIQDTDNFFLKKYLLHFFLMKLLCKKGVSSLRGFWEPMLPTLQPLALNSLAQALSKPVKAFNIAPTRTEISFSNRTTSFFSVR